MMGLVAFSALAALFQVAALSIGGATLTVPLLAAIAMLSIACTFGGATMLALADRPLVARLPAAFVAGYGLVSISMFALAALSGLSPLISVAGFTIAGVVGAFVFGRDRPSAGWTDTALAALIALAVLALSVSTMGSVVALDKTGVFPMWVDAYLHAISIYGFTAMNAIPTDPELFGATVVPYHYGSFLPPAALIEASGLDGLTVVAAHQVPLGLFVGALGLYVLVGQVAGRAAAMIALSLLVLLPDPSTYMLRSGWFDVVWLLYTSPGAGYGIGLCFLSAACLHAGIGGGRSGGRLVALAVALALLAVFLRVQMFMLLAPPLLAVWLWATFPRARRSLGIASTLGVLAIFAALALFPSLRALWIEQSHISEYLQLSMRLTVHYKEWIAPLIGKGAASGLVKLGLVIVLSLGVLLLVAPVLATAKVRKLGADPIDLLPAFALATYVLLILFAPAGSNGSATEYKHRHFIELYWLFAGFSAIWASSLFAARQITAAAFVTTIAAMGLAFAVSGRPIDAPDTAAMPWSKAFFNAPATKGVRAAAAFVSQQMKPGDVFAAETKASAINIGAINEFMARVDIPAYVARADLKSLRSPCHASAVADRLGVLGRIEDATDIASALGLLRQAGPAFYVRLSGFPRWDPTGSYAAFSDQGIAVYETGAPVRDRAFWSICDTD